MQRGIGHILMLTLGCLIGGLAVMEDTKTEVRIAWERGRDAALDMANPDKIPVETRQFPDGTFVWKYNPEPDYIKRRYCEK